MRAKERYVLGGRKNREIELPSRNTKEVFYVDAKIKE